MANLSTLKNNGNVIYPMTVFKAVLDSSGKTLEVNFNTLKEQVDSMQLKADLFLGVFAKGSDIPSQGKEGQYAIVTKTDSFWLWDTETSKWIDSGVQSPVVFSVNSKTGNVILSASDITATLNTDQVKSINEWLQTIINRLDEVDDNIIDINNRIDSTNQELSLKLNSSDCPTKISNLTQDINYIKYTKLSFTTEDWEDSSVIGAYQLEISIPLNSTLVNVSKLVNETVRVSVVYDYEISGTSLIIFSDVKFDGTALVLTGGD